MANPDPSTIQIEPYKWQPGQSGNPAGRAPKGYTITDLMKAKLDDVDPEKKKTYRELLVNKLFKLAIRKGDIAAIKLAMQYVEGMPLQRTDVTSGGKPINQLSGETLAKIDEAYAKQTDTIPEPNPA